MSRILSAAALAAMLATALVFSGSAPARADADAPVCAEIYDQGGSYRQCDFYNYAQCQATISGRSGQCFANIRNPGDSLNQMPAGPRTRR